MINHPIIRSSLSDLDDLDGKMEDKKPPTSNQPPADLGTTSPHLLPYLVTCHLLVKEIWHHNLLSFAAPVEWVTVVNVGPR